MNKETKRAIIIGMVTAVIVAGSIVAGVSIKVKAKESINKEILNDAFKSEREILIKEYNDMNKIIVNEFSVIRSLLLRNQTLKFDKTDKQALILSYEKLVKLSEDKDKIYTIQGANTDNFKLYSEIMNLHSNLREFVVNFGFVVSETNIKAFSDSTNNIEDVIEIMGKINDLIE